MALFNSAHGGNIREAATVLGISPDQLLDFSANINPLGMPVSVKRALIDNLDCIERYPDADYFHSASVREFDEATIIRYRLYIFCLHFVRLFID